MKHATIAVVSATLLALSGGTGLAQQEKQPDATITFTGGSLALGAGYEWGSGTLHFRGGNYRFSANGLSMGSIGGSSSSGNAQVYNLKRLEDFPGHYVAVAAGAAFGGGGGAAEMQNQNGVVIRLAALSAGVQFTLAPAGMAVTLDRPQQSARR